MSLWTKMRIILISLPCNPSSLSMDSNAILIQGLQLESIDQTLVIIPISYRNPVQRAKKKQKRIVKSLAMMVVRPMVQL